MSLADELLADFDEIKEESEETIQISEKPIYFVKPSRKNSINDIAVLLQSEKMRSVLSKISESSNQQTDSNYNKEYEIVVEANSLLAEIDNELNIVYKFTKDIYKKRLSELESLITAPFDYIKTVHHLGNTFDLSKVESIDFLPPAIKMVVSVTVSADPGQPLSPEDVRKVTEACDMAFDLIGAKIKIMDYVQSRMFFIAPNLCRVIGANTAAQIMGVAGGLDALAKMPACNILLLGSQKRNLAGFSTTSILPHSGKKAARVVSAKIALTVRIDSNKEHRDGSFGDKMLDEITKKYDRWLAPPPVKITKALPRPDDQPRRKRGGRRQRNMKQKYAMTELRKQANRVHFGIIQEDVYQDSIGFGLNALTQAGSDKLRMAPIDTKTKISISKRLQKNLASMSSSVFGTKTSIRSNLTSGSASSVAFTPLQGIEIINPSIAKEGAESSKDSLKYFSHKSGFQSSKQLPDA